jgi:hypothetical protein
MLIVYPCMIIMLLSIWYSWMIHEKNLLCAKLGIVMPLLTLKFNAQIQGEFLYFSMNCQGYISKVKSYLSSHQTQKRGRLKVHLGP